MNALVDDQVLRRTEIMRDCDKYYYKPDGSINVRNFQDVMKLLPHFEVKNSTGEGGSDPIHQAWCDYAFTILQETYVFFLSTLQNVDCLVASAHLSGMLLSCIWSGLLVHTAHQPGQANTTWTEEPTNSSGN